MLDVAHFFKNYQRDLTLQLVAGGEGLKKKIKTPEVHRPGLGLTGFLKTYSPDRILIFGKAEILYLRELSLELSRVRLDGILTQKTPLVIVSRRLVPPQELIASCKKRRIPLFRSPLTTRDLSSRISSLLKRETSPAMTCHGTLVEAFGVGVLIQGDSAIGKSETALGLIEHGHRLISDDIVQIGVREGNILEGSGPELTRHLMEIRGIGIINVAHLYGAVCVRDRKSIDLIVKLEAWDDRHFYDRVGLEEKYCEMLGVKVPIHLLPLKPGRDVVLLLETIALNHRLKKRGLDSAKEFNTKLLQAIAKKQKKQGSRLQSILREKG
ncbi:MAG: HPr(Ser) kinase/phosphatase [Chlamydiae bacterium GWC2_50_10]|nr:MAG: HPr(Ser) kinase/phosphatase [Chlamydiae bacterium GWA2_50_15]OGN54054.1 MAG: HPr(Ser) kinase/phosphatase [Chlamydiae bacterium GWC2_50_10]OGN54885.1 MAG: HPr(Ser) kinase/phosphatase [Chlamydiae bacterium GWF2_49_8]OGN58640.1 MAG: HPr(Ser) kinase/phosphatase [Chlamydiae bacterium RIFCSPHIGHO2_02_FULL_49_29]OGN63848.1 MAG: HPr(Ser) kinase/phosphatase [Chlamydiae bacterium RIFCSPHIGHO2_12_FULL_49_32]OGN70280.1 MAG: HPr(Ser) kinase/phosphatase [Chlamydiae bacterium RIFCSPLOWO2_02_FULL_49_1